ncbi:MAG TPA: sigma-70 family RNA polymerase sigma factor [Pyrinomonadaceae bacterium]|nr:sigma-70 family RNA polymerase sigma factor [Pyrinomonadaceae bacterium]
MKKDRELTQNMLDKLLGWLDPDRERAGSRYEEIRRRLIKFFTCRGCYDAEDLADETISRVMFKVEELAPVYSGDPALYFYGVADKVQLEYFRNRKRGEAAHTTAAALPPVEPQDEEDARRYECLDRCMSELPPNNRHFIVEYYREEKGAKIANRKKLAEQLAVNLNVLRIRACRIRVSLEECVRQCLAGRAA